MDDKFFKRYYPLAIREHILSGIPASVTLAQAALESDYGRSELSKQFNNFFGIKGSGVLFPSPEFIDGEFQSVNSEFRKYVTPSASFRDHSRFLRENSRYEALAFITDPFLYAEQLQVAGYATDPNYADKLKQLISSNDLTKFDRAGKFRYLIIVTFVIMCMAIIFLLIKNFSK